MWRKMFWNEKREHQSFLTLSWEMLKAAWFYVELPPLLKIILGRYKENIWNEKREHQSFLTLSREMFTSCGCCVGYLPRDYLTFIWGR